MSELTYRIKHRTSYEYSGRIDLCHSLLHLRPCEEKGQNVVEHKIHISPSPGFQSVRKDYFGNTTQYFSIQQSHGRLEVTSFVTVTKQEVTPEIPDSGITLDNEAQLSEMANGFESGIPLLNFLEPSCACPNIEQLDTFLKPTIISKHEIIEIAHDLMSRIFTDFTYLPGATQVSTPLIDVLAKKHGVCQDFAHVMIAALRRIGIPARYVSGYLETVPPPGQEKLQGADATHAWVEAYTPKTGWVGFDPTNDQIPGHQHIKICHGRDYFDVQPLRGVFLGAGSQKLLVEVDVERV